MSKSGLNVRAKGPTGAVAPAMLGRYILNGW